MTATKLNGPFTKLSPASRAYSKSYPQPGQTKFSPGMGREMACAIAHEHYGSGVEVILHMEGGAAWAVKVMGSWKAICGIVDGRDAILHKTDGGHRELDSYLPETEEAQP